MRDSRRRLTQLSRRLNFGGGGDDGGGCSRTDERAEKRRSLMNARAAARAQLGAAAAVAALNCACPLDGSVCVCVRARIVPSQAAPFALRRGAGCRAMRELRDSTFGRRGPSFIAHVSRPPRPPICGAAPLSTAPQRCQRPDRPAS